MAQTIFIKFHLIAGFSSYSSLIPNTLVYQGSQNLKWNASMQNAIANTIYVGMSMKDLRWFYLEFKYWVFIYTPWTHTFLQSEICVFLALFTILNTEGKTTFKKSDQQKLQVFFFFFFWHIFPFLSSKFEINFLMDLSSYSHNETCEKCMRIFNIS